MVTETLPAEYASYLPILARAKAALTQARTIDEVKALRDKALAMKLYAQQAKDRTLEIDAAEIRVRAERRAGEMLIETERNGQRRDRRGDGSNQRKRKSQEQTSTPNDISSPPTLKQLGLTRNQSSQFQKTAAVPESQFESKLDECRESGQPPTTKHVLGKKPVRKDPKPRKAKAKKKEDPQPESSKSGVVRLLAGMEQTAWQMFEGASSNERTYMIEFFEQLADEMKAIQQKAK